MCDRCADIDYRVADVWRPCYVPTSRPQPTTRPAHGEDYFESQRIIQALRHQVRQLTWQIESMKSAQGHEAVKGARTVEPVSVAILD